MDVLTLYVGNDTLLELEHLSDEAGGAVVNNATVTVTLRDPSGNAVGGETWPLAMPYVASTNGCYRTTLADTLGVVAGTRYSAEIIADAGAGKRGRWKTDLIAKERRR